MEVLTKLVQSDIKNFGIGIGLRVPHIPYILEHHPKIDFFEIISENFMVDGGLPLYNLERILERYPVVQHGVSLSLASADPLDFEYLKRLKKLTQKTKTPWFSDHLCWSSVDRVHYHDLLPVPYTKAFIKHIVEKARIVQDYMELPFAVENLSSYVSFKDSEMTEWEFLTTIIEQANCSVLLDVNNIYVSSVNHHFDPNEYLDYIPVNRVVQTHIAGHSVQENGTLLDTHDHPVCREVWDLYRQLYQKTGGVTTLLEWDDNFLTFEETYKEALKAKQYQILEKSSL